MAASSTTRKNKTPSKKRGVASQKNKAEKLSRQRGYVAGVFLLVFSIIFGVFIYLSSIGVVGNAIHEFLYGLFGLATVFIPLVLFALGLYGVIKKNPSGIISKSIFLFFALLALAGIFAQFSLQIILPSTPMECFTSGKNGLGGGLFGGSLYLFLSRMTGNVVCAIIFILLLILFITLTTHFSLFRFIAGLFRGLSEHRETVKETVQVDYEKSYEAGKKAADKSTKAVQKFQSALPKRREREKTVDIPLSEEEAQQSKLNTLGDDADALKAEATFAKLKKTDESLKQTISTFPVYGMHQDFNKNQSRNDVGVDMEADIISTGTNSPASAPTTTTEKAPYSGHLPNQYSTMPTEEGAPSTEEPFVSAADQFKSDEELERMAHFGDSTDPAVVFGLQTEESIPEQTPQDNVITYDLSDVPPAEETPPIIPDEPASNHRPTQAESLHFPPAPGIGAAAKEHNQNVAILEDIHHEDTQGIPQKPEIIPYIFPNASLLDMPSGDKSESYEKEIRENVVKLVNTLASFNVPVSPLQASRGPAVTRYELQPGPGVKVSKITNLADDIALNLAATSVRIEAPIPGKAAVGIEVPNKNVSIVSLREVIESEAFAHAKSKLAVALGMDIAGNPVIGDVAKMPHVLIAGATGSGKSVCINTLITSLIFKATPNEVKFIMIDPKVVELGIYNGIPHLLVPVVTDPNKAAGSLNWAVQEMTRRYGLFAENGVRDIKSYNQYITEKFGEEYRMPNIVIIIDELADLMMVAPNDVEDAICRLAQMARAAGMHLVIATQRPSVDVITGIIKANIPSRIAFAVSSQVDSRTILDMVGAEKLLGKGDMLYYPVGASKPKRLQGAFVSDKEIEHIVDFIKSGSEANYDEDIIDSMNTAALGGQKDANSDSDGDADELLPQAIEIAVDLGQISTSFIQRRLKVGYARAGRIIDQMEERGIISGFDGSKPRNVLITKEQWYQMNQ